ncbi:hypothetical protein LXL04_004055 [Taraxacum kok-saghyz]
MTWIHGGIGYGKLGDWQYPSVKKISQELKCASFLKWKELKRASFSKRSGELFVMLLELFVMSFLLCTMHEPSTSVGKGQLLLAKGDVNQAFAMLVLNSTVGNTPSALQVNPVNHAGVRLGIGLSRYKLGQFERAKQAFERILQASHPYRHSYMTRQSHSVTLTWLRKLTKFFHQILEQESLKIY